MPCSHEKAKFNVSDLVFMKDKYFLIRRSLLEKWKFHGISGPKLNFMEEIITKVRYMSDNYRGISIY